MRKQPFLLALLTLSSGTASATAADLSRIDRTIAKQPAYKSKTVKYALLVFGPEAKTRVWLALDGDTLYVDRNGNGDLTDDGEKIAAEKSEARDPADGEHAFKVSEIRAGALVHRDLYVSVSKLSRQTGRGESIQAILKKDSAARGYHVMCDIEMPGWKGREIGGRVRQRAFYLDAHGVLQFAETPEKAPIIHFAGRWQVSLFGPHGLALGRDGELVLGVGTPGVGPGTMGWIDYEGVIPADGCPVADITFPPSKPGDPPVRQRYELKRRC